MMELLAAFESAVASTAEIVKSTSADQMDAPTPCAEWDVRALLNHVIGTLWLAEGLFSDQAPRYPMAPGGLPPGDLAGDDPAAAYAQASAAALAAAAAGDALTRVHPTSQSRAGRIGPELPVQISDPVTSRLAAFLGRQP